ncbi:class I SAM-dependent methyltransferase [Psychromonas sp. CD1]|uniref:class I SAM-dependent methyltransferase n=1 Tax=Psychromonas sp. CD1 TaxID=1979839 RepID=UPI000B9B3C44|nr:class I SAM-dependent methyltransferase [Psychromonas sp. CD1]
MILNKEWRILTIGDGDLSFSASLQKHFSPRALSATVYDSLETLSEKYNDVFYQYLQQENIQTLFDFNVCQETSWINLEKNSFDLVIFQFPLLPAFRNFDEYKTQTKNSNINLLNRRLLRHFLLNSFKYFLDPNGQQLCFITSKDVKPYQQWNIENALNMQTNIHYLGSMAFDIKKFPGYKIRNVDRDKHVRDTQGETYVWSLRCTHSIQEQLHKLPYHGANNCSICRAGPFSTIKDKHVHLQSKKHLQMMSFERD